MLNKILDFETLIRFLTLKIHTTDFKRVKTALICRRKVGSDVYMLYSVRMAFTEQFPLLFIKRHVCDNKLETAYLMFYLCLLFKLLNYLNINLITPNQNTTNEDLYESSDKKHALNLAQTEYF